MTIELLFQNVKRVLCKIRFATQLLATIQRAVPAGQDVHVKMRATTGQPAGPWSPDISLLSKCP